MYLFLCESRSTGDPYVGLDCVELLSSIYRSKRDQGIRTEQKSLKIWDKKNLHNISTFQFIFLCNLIGCISQQ